MNRRTSTAVAIVVLGGILSVLAGCGFGPQDSQVAATPVALAGEEPKSGPSREGEKTAPKEKTTKTDEKTADKEPPKKSGEEKPKDDEIRHPFPRRMKAPSFDGAVGWLNTAGPLDVKDLKGKFVILDFWTYCCINCIHILPELKKLEKAHPDDLVVIGVHSAKFETEKGTNNIREAILRHEIEHPVVNDADHKIWDRYFVSSWPSLRVIDPEGNLVAGHSGELKFEDLDRFLKMATPYYKKKGVMDLTPLKFKLETKEPTPLRFPGKVLADEAGGRLFIADSNHNRIVISSLDGELREVIGMGEAGHKDGDYKTATFDHPQGMVLKGDMLYVADTESHTLRKVDLKKKTVVTIAGTGKQRHGLWPGMMGKDGIPMIPDRYVGDPKKEALSSPWALCIEGDDLFIAMAGPHQIWKMTLDEKEIGPYAGNGREDVVDGPLLPKQPFERGFSSFAQPSGLTSDGEWIYVADSEGSSIRAVPVDPKKEARTILGTAEQPGARLFTFGDVDGELKKALLQHPLGVSFYKGQLYLTDTYNNKVKVVDLKEKTIKTLAGTGKPGADNEPAAFDEPAGLSAAAGKVFVADTNNHAIRVIDLEDENKVSTLKINGLTPPTPPKRETKPDFRGAKQIELDGVKLRPEDGKVKLVVDLKLPEGWKINADAPMAYLIESSAAKGAVKRAAVGKLIRVSKPEAQFEIELPINDAVEDALKVSLKYYYCQKTSIGLCKMGSVVWSLPLAIDPEATRTAAQLEHKIQELALSKKLKLGSE